MFYKLLIYLCEWNFLGVTTNDISQGQPKKKKTKIVTTNDILQKYTLSNIIKGNESIKGKEWDKKLPTTLVFGGIFIAYHIRWLFKYFASLWLQDFVE